MEISGSIKKILEQKTFNSGFTLREIVVTTKEQYPQDILIQFTQDKVSMVDNLNEGEEVKVSINIRGREWTSPQNEVKYFVSIDGWRIEKIAAQATSTPPELPPAPESVPDFAAETKTTEEDDLPF